MANEKKPDRRVRRTRRALRNALVETLLEKKLRTVTVRELCAKADVNRSTFYLHFRDVYDLWRAVEQEVLDDMTAVMERFPGDLILTHPLPLLKKISEVLEKEVAFNKKLFRSGESVLLMEKVKKAFIAYFTGENPAWVERIGSKNFEIYITFVMSGAFALYTKWLLEDWEISLDTLARAVERLIVSGVEDFLKRPPYSPGT